MDKQRTAPLSEGDPTYKDYGSIQVKGSDNSSEKQIFKQDYPANFDAKALIGGDLAKADKMHVEAQREALNGKSSQKVLRELLAQINPVDFREKSGLGGDEKIVRKHYVTISIDEVLEVATVNNWGLCTRDGFIYVFNGKFWQVVDVAEFKSFLGDTALKMGVPPLEARYHQFKEDLYKQFISASNLPTLEVGDKVLINLMNGTFEIGDDKQELREQRREDFLKYQLPFEYKPDARCPMFDKYLNRVVPDLDCQKLLAEYIGYVFINNLKLEKALLLYGSGANGKSVFFEVVTAILGSENICSYSLQSLTKFDGYQRAELSNKLLNYASEISGKLETSIFKQLVSGEPVEARHIYGKPFNMLKYAKLMFNCNELPKEVEQTDAFFRRFIIVPFNQTILEKEQDPNLSKKIIASELSGVFNWILDGLRRLLRQQKFTDAALAREQIEAYRRESDSVALFVEEEGYKRAIEGNISFKEMFSEYKTFCYDNGYRICSSKTFSDRIKKLGFETERRNRGIIVFAEK